MPTTGREARHLELEQAICDVPGDLRAWQVYADWLQSHGDAWGERLSLGLARGRGRSRDHNYLSPGLADALVRALGPIVSIGAIETPEVWDGQAHYFTQVGE
jgi:uncharacterized protein (TIGR02996 family)